jgi:hypothetical protein
MVKIGDKRLGLTLIEKIKVDKRVEFFNCKCECGNTKKIRPNKFGKTYSCGCRLSAKGDKNHKWTGYQGIQGSIWCGYVRNAEKRNIPFEITIKDGWEIFEKQKEKCNISKVKINFGRRHRTPTTASLDRIDNKKGYIKTNVHWVHKKINQIKMDMSLDEFIEWCKKVANAN